MNAKTTTTAITETAVAALRTGGVTALANPDVIKALSVLVYRAPKDNQENCQNRRALVHALRSTLSAEYPWILVRDFQASFEIHLDSALYTDIFPAAFETLLWNLAATAPLSSMAPSILVQDRNHELVTIATGADYTFTVKYLSPQYGTSDTTVHSLAEAIAHIEEHSTAKARKSWWKRIFG